MRRKLRTIHPYTLATLLLILAACFMARADDQPPTPTQIHSTHHATKLGAASDQPGIVVNKNQIEFGRMLGKTHQITRGIYPIKRRYTLYINGVSITTNDPDGVSANGIELKEAITISGGNYRQTDVVSRYVDAPDISKFQNFVDTMEMEAEKPPQDGDNTQSTFITPGGTTLTYQRNGKSDTDFMLQNEDTDAWVFHFTSSKDMADFKQAVDKAATWVSQQTTTPTK